MIPTSLGDYLVNGALIIIMWGLGISLSFKDFKNIFLYPKGLIIGLSAQLILMPTVAFLIAFLTNLSPAFSVGLVIISICPGGASSNLITYLIRGNVALSVSMTIMNSFIAVFTIPFLAGIALWFFMQTQSEISLPFWGTVLNILVITIIPTYLGLFFKSKYPKTAAIMQRPMKFIMPSVLAVVFIYKIFFEQNKNQIGIDLNEILYLAPFVIGLNILGMLAGYLMGTIFKLGNSSKLTIVIEVGLQNTALALMIGGVILNNFEIEKPALVYALFTFFTTILFALGVKYMHKKQISRRNS